MLKSKRLAIPLLWMLLGAGYFSTISQFALHPLLKDYLIIVPLQVLAIVYIFLLRREHPASDSTLNHQPNSFPFDQFD